ncbi:hypothetical protein SAMN02787144_1006279 [Streptomyces atratus]|uniref:Uncharacterized protein n=1 Tax=Streptomyces atratus TaxID=1893 RepID=A0A1K2A540_STRAR|nr:hypothetical protein SAMN02787144_1006279 [Streptomyces atratus]
MLNNRLGQAVRTHLSGLRGAEMDRAGRPDRRTLLVGGLMVASAALARCSTTSATPMATGHFAGGTVGHARRGVRETDGRQYDRVLRGEADESLVAAECGGESEERQVVAGAAFVAVIESFADRRPGGAVFRSVAPVPAGGDDDARGFTPADADDYSSSDGRTANRPSTRTSTRTVSTARSRSRSPTGSGRTSPSWAPATTRTTATRTTSWCGGPTVGCPCTRMPTRPA